MTTSSASAKKSLSVEMEDTEDSRDDEALALAEAGVDGNVGKSSDEEPAEEVAFGEDTSKPSKR